MREPGPDLTGPPLSSGQADKISAALKVWLRESLIAQGRSGEAAWAEMTPIQRLEVAGVVPPSLTEFVPMVNGVMEVLKIQERGPLSDEGRVLFAYILGTMEARSVMRPQIMEDFRNLGLLLYDDGAYDSLIMKLFAGETFDASEL